MMLAIANRHSGWFSMCSVPDHFGEFVAASREKDLYKPLIDYLYGDFDKQQRSTFGHSHITVQDVSTIPDSEGGQWTRPDVAAVLLRRHKYAAAATVDLLSFEVKRHGSVDLSAVHEALAHARFVHCAHLVWNRPACHCQDRENYERILKNCELYGLGLIGVHNPRDLRTFEIKLAPVRSAVSDDALDAFIESRFSEENKSKIKSKLKSYCAGPL